MSLYPRYSTWHDPALDAYEVVRWINPKTFEVVQSNIRTPEKARQALSEWRDREVIHRRITQLDAMAADMHAINLKLEHDIDAWEPDRHLGGAL